MKKIITLAFIFSIANQTCLLAQLTSASFSNKQNEQPNFYDIQREYHQKEKNPINPADLATGEFEEDRDHTGWLQFGRWEEFMEPRVYPSGNLNLPKQAAENYKNYLDSLSHGFILRTSSVPNNSSSTGGNWVSLSPSLVIAPIGNNVGVNGRTDFVRFSPANSSTIFVGSYTGGLWKSVDTGATWANLTDNLPFIGCYDLAISSSNPDKMYLATGTLGGANYTYDIGIRKTMDGGITWTPLNIPVPLSPYGSIKRLLIDPSNDDVVIAATFDGIYKTIDGGISWTKTQTGAMLDIKFKPGNPSIVYATREGSGNARFYRSVDAGNSFVETTSGLQTANSNAIGMKIGVTVANPDYVYLLAMSSGTSYQAVYRSTDGGLNFNTRDSTNTTIRLNYTTDFMAITANPLDAEDVYVAGYVPYRSTDGGVNWAARGGNMYIDYHFLDYLPGSSTTLFACGDGGFYKTNNNGGSTWISIETGLKVTQMYKMGASTYNPNKILTGQQDVGIFLKNNNAWTQLYQADGMECIFDPVDTNTYYMSTQYGALRKSTDAGANFSSITFSPGSGISTAGNWVTPFIMHPADHNTLLTGKDSIYRTTDGGSTWSAIDGSYSLIFKYTALAYAPSDPSYIYGATYNSFYACTNGNTFTKRTATFPGAITSIVVSNINPEKVWIGLSGYSSGNKVYASTDAGITWSDYSTGLPNLPVNCLVYQNNTNDRIFAGMDVGVYTISDSLSGWELFSNGLPNVQIRDMEIQYTVNKIRAATYGRGLWESDLDINTGINNFSHSNTMFSIYPNPATDRFVIQLKNYSFKKHVAVLELYNSLGAQVHTQILTEEKTEININLPSGIYITKVNNGIEVNSRKLIVD